MSENAISVSSLSKWFNTSTRSEGLRETIASKLTPSRRHDTVTGFWALRDV